MQFFPRSVHHVTSLLGGDKLRFRRILKFDVLRWRHLATLRKVERVCTTKAFPIKFLGLGLMAIPLSQTELLEKCDKHANKHANTQTKKRRIYHDNRGG